jgi:hypothetical protein
MAKKLGGKARQVTMPVKVPIHYVTVCSIRGCDKRAKWAFNKAGKARGACSRKHLRIVSGR